MGASEKQLGVLLDHGNPPEYVQWHRKRILSCVKFLSDCIPLKDMATLDIGHDVHVGGLLAHSGCSLRGNVPPDDLGGHEPQRGTAKYIDPTGNSFQWGLDAFDFEKPFPYADGTFDIVTTMEVIEHVNSSPRMFIQEIRRILKPGGYIFIATPNAASWAKIMRSFAHGPTYDAKPYSQNFGPRHVMCHVYEYTPWELRELLKSEGFEITKLATWDVYESDPNGIRATALKLMMSAAMLLTGHLKLSALLFRNRGHQMVVVARLPR